MVQLGDYPEVFQTAFADRVVRRPEAANAQLQIYGPLEARLTQSDRVILGGLVEGVWPPAPRIDPWLSRPMRHELGLDLPERRIGLSAHDFAQLLGAEEVILSHAAKVGGAPAVASRFLHRLEAVAGEARWKAAKAAGEKYVRFAGELDRPDKVKPIDAARAKAAARDAAAETVGDRDRGLAARSLYDLRQIYFEAGAARSRRHAAVGRRPRLGDPRRARRIHPNLRDRASRQSRARLRGIGEKYFAPLMERPEARALWWPRFQRIAEWFADWEIARRGDVSTHRRRDPGRDSDSPRQ